MTELTEGSLEWMLIKLREQMDKEGQKITIKPTHYLIHPDDEAALRKILYNED